MSMIGSTVQI